MASKENVSALVGGMGVAASLITSLVKEVRERGGKDEDIHRLVTPRGETTLNKIADLIVNDGKPPIDPFKNDKREDGWILLQDAGFSPIDPADLELVLYLRPDERYVFGEELVRRAREDLSANLGQRHAEYFLEHQESIRFDFRPYTLVFTGTIWRNLIGEKHVVYLYWHKGELKWVLDFARLGDAWGREYDYRLVRPSRTN